MARSFNKIIQIILLRVKVFRNNNHLKKTNISSFSKQIKAYNHMMHRNKIFGNPGMMSVGGWYRLIAWILKDQAIVRGEKM